MKKYLLLLLNNSHFESKIKSITELREQLGRNINSLADNFARHYRKRGLKPNKWNNGRKLKVCKITTSIIIKKWKKLNVSD